MFQVLTKTPYCGEPPHHHYSRVPCPQHVISPTAGMVTCADTTMSTPWSSPRNDHKRCLNRHRDMYDHQHRSSNIWGRPPPYGPGNMSESSDDKEAPGCSAYPRLRRAPTASRITRMIQNQARLGHVPRACTGPSEQQTRAPQEWLTPLVFASRPPCAPPRG